MGCTSQARIQSTSVASCKFLFTTYRMATAGAVLGVIRASRPILRTAIERVAFAVHAAFLATGYSLVAVGAAANADANAYGAEEPEVGFEGWNTLEGAYAFRYVGDGQFDLCKSVTLKIVVMVGSLMVDVVPTGTEILHHLEIRGSDFAKDGDEASNYAQQFASLENLVKQINDMILSKLSPPRIMTSDNITSTSSTSLQNECISDARQASPPPLLYDIQQSTRNLGIMPFNVRYDPIGPLEIPSSNTIDYDRFTNKPPCKHFDLEHF